MIAVVPVVAVLIAAMLPVSGAVVAATVAGGAYAALPLALLVRSHQWDRAVRLDQLAEQDPDVIAWRRLVAERAGQRGAWNGNVRIIRPRVDPGVRE